MLLKKEMPIAVKQEESQPPLEAVEVHDVVTVADEDTLVQLSTKRRKHNDYMKKYRAHQRFLPTYTALLRYSKSPITFNTVTSMVCTAQIIDNILIIRIQHGPCDTGMMEQREFVLPTDNVKKFVSHAITMAYKTV